MRLGDGVMVIGMLAWLAVAVGPWWIAPALFALAWIINVVVASKTGKLKP